MLKGRPFQKRGGGGGHPNWEFPSDGLERYVLSILMTSGGSQAQTPLKRGSNHLQTLMSRKYPFSKKTNPHLQIPSRGGLTCRSSVGPPSQLSEPRGWKAAKLIRLLSYRSAEKGVVLIRGLFRKFHLVVSVVLVVSTKYWNL